MWGANIVIYNSLEKVRPHEIYESKKRTEIN